MVTIRNRRRLWLLEWGLQDAEIALNASIPWRIEIRGGATGVNADLTGLDLLELAVSYGMSAVHLKLPVPSGTVPLRVSGGASDVTITHPARVPVRVQFAGWASSVSFHGDLLSGLRNDPQLQSPGYDAAHGRYDIDISGNASMVTIIASGTD